MTSKFQFVGEKVKLGGFISASGERNKSLRCTDVYSVTNSLGFTPSAEYFSKEVFSKDLKTYRVVRRGMIAYNPSRINVGSVALQDKRSEVIVSPLYVVFEVDESRLLPEFLLRFLKSKRGLEQIASSSTGTVRNNLKFDALCGMEIRLPSLADQHECVGRLKAISNQISALDLTLERLDQLVKSRFVEMFGSPDSKQVVALEDCCSSIVGGKTPSMKHPEYYGGGVPFIKSGDVIGDRVSGGALSLSQYALEHASVKLVPAGSVLVVTRSARLRKEVHCAVCTNDVAINQDIKAFTPLPEFTSDYLLWAIRAHEQDLLKTVRSVSTSSMDLGTLCGIGISQAPLFLQQEFADFVAKVDKPRFVATTQIGDNSPKPLKHAEAQAPLPDAYCNKAASINPTDAQQTRRAPRSRYELAMRELHVVLVDHRIAKRRIYLAVPQENLNLLDGHSLIYRLCGKSSPKLMRMNMLDPRSLPYLAKARFHSADLKTLERPTQRNEQCGRIIQPGIQVRKQMGFRASVEVNPALLVPLAMHDALASLKIDITTIEPHKLPHPDSRRRKQINHRQVTNFNAGITQLLKGFVGVDRLQNARCPDLLYPPNRALVDVVLLFKPREKARDNPSYVVDSGLTRTTTPRIIRQIIPNIVSRDLVSLLLNRRNKALERARIVSKRAL